MGTLTDYPNGGDPAGDAAEWTANEIYEIAATDPVEGAAGGASSGGIGVDNLPHQQLANRTAFLNGKRVIDEANIAVIQAFDANFVSQLAAIGYIKLGVNDVNPSVKQAILQWGNVNFGSEQPEGLYGPYNFPIAFPNACLTMQITSGNGGPGVSGDAVAEIPFSNPPTKSQFWMWLDNVGTSGAKNMGFYWFAIGY